MIQRIQTLWMFVTAALTGGLVAPLAGDPATHIWIIAIVGLAALVPLVAMFLFRNHDRQISMLIAEFVLLAGALGFAVYHSWIAYTAWSYAPVAVFIALATNWLALRGVLRDRMLLRSADRLR